jgi:hypothetical protein
MFQKIKNKKIWTERWCSRGDVEILEARGVPDLLEIER